MVHEKGVDFGAISAGETSQKHIDDYTLQAHFPFSSRFEYVLLRNESDQPVTIQESPGSPQIRAKEKKKIALNGASSITIVNEGTGAISAGKVVGDVGIRGCLCL